MKRLSIFAIIFYSTISIANQNNKMVQEFNEIETQITQLGKTEKNTYNFLRSHQTYIANVYSAKNQLTGCKDLMEVFDGLQTGMYSFLVKGEPKSVLCIIENQRLVDSQILDIDKDSSSTLSLESSPVNYKTITCIFNRDESRDNKTLCSVPDIAGLPEPNFKSTKGCRLGKEYGANENGIWVRSPLCGSSFNVPTLVQLDARKSTLSSSLKTALQPTSNVNSKIIGSIDGTRVLSGMLEIWGWTCLQNRYQSIEYHVYAGPAGKGQYLGKGIAKNSAGDFVAKACGTRGAHRFRFKIELNKLSLFKGRWIHIYGISPSREITGNQILDNSGPGFFKIP